MKVLVTGGRDWSAQWVIRERLCEFRPATLVEGGQSGADTIARAIASALGADVVTYWANWKRYSKAAGPIRNQRMLLREKPDLVLAFPMPGSIGTWDMVKQATKAGIPVRAFDAQNHPLDIATKAGAVDPHASSTGKPTPRVSESSSSLATGGPSRLRALISSWRHSQLVAGQYSVECPIDDAAGAEDVANAFKRCADELEALVGPVSVETTQDEETKKS